MARYLHPDEALARPVVAKELEQVLDVLQPGWRQVVVEHRLMPRMLVANGHPAASAPRPEPAVPGVPGLYLAGDWVGDEGMLADAALASARRAAREILHGSVEMREAA